MLRLIAVVLSCVFLHAGVAHSASPCTSFRPPIEPAVDLAPPSGFVEICGQDAALCQRLTSGYPPSAKTLGYFATAQEWTAFRSGTREGFSRYLIAQLATNTPPARFAELREGLRLRQGRIPDNTELPATLDADGRVQIGIFEDAADAIAFGIVMKLRPAGMLSQSPFLLASTNTALLLGQRVLSLYTYLDIKTMDELGEVKTLTKDWLSCLRKAN